MSDLIVYRGTLIRRAVRNIQVEVTDLAEEVRLIYVPFSISTITTIVEVCGQHAKSSKLCRCQKGRQGDSITDQLGVEINLD